MSKNGTSKWAESEVRDALLNKRVGKEEMDHLVKVMLIGKDDDETTPGTEDDEEAGKSQQLDEFQQQASGEFIPPTYNPSIWAQTPKVNTRLSRCIRSYARNTVGLGWHIEPIHPITPETPDADRKTIEEQTEILRDFFTYPNDKMPFSELAYLMKYDEESAGNGYWEIVRNNGGAITKLYHAPATTMRRRLMKPEAGAQPVVYGFVQIRGNQKRYFKEFGDKRVMNAKSGTWVEGKDPLPVEDRATEIIQFMIYDPTNSYYGAPRYVPSSTAIAGNRQSAIRNVNFFENDAVPRMALLVSGGRLTGESMQQIEDFVRGKQKGVENAHRVMVIQVEPSKVGFQQQNKTAIELKPLTVGVTEDASFQTYRSANDEEVREVFGMHPIFFTGENVNKASAAVGREITNEQEFEPDRLAKEYIINQTLVYELLTAHLGNNPATPDDPDEMREYRKKIRVQFRFARLTLTDPLDQARMDQIYASLAAMTPNELRERIGKPPFPKDFFFAEKPLMVAMAELSAGLALAIAVQPEQSPPQPEMPGASGAAPAGDEPSDTLSVKPPSPGESPEVPNPQDDPKAKKPKGPKVAPELAFSIVNEMMADARRMYQIGAMVGNVSGGDR